jgi:hypothetical protein
MTIRFRVKLEEKMSVDDLAREEIYGAWWTEWSSGGNAERRGVAGILYGMMERNTGLLLVPLRCSCLLEAIYKLFRYHQLPMSMKLPVILPRL